MVDTAVVKEERKDQYNITISQYQLQAYHMSRRCILPETVAAAAIIMIYMSYCNMSCFAMKSQYTSEIYLCHILNCPPHHYDIIYCPIF